MLLSYLTLDNYNYRYHHNYNYHHNYDYHYDDNYHCNYHHNYNYDYNYFHFLSKGWSRMLRRIFIKTSTLEINNDIINYKNSFRVFCLLCVYVQV